MNLGVERERRGQKEVHLRLPRFRLIGDPSTVTADLDCLASLSFRDQLLHAVSVKVDPLRLETKGERGKPVVIGERGDLLVGSWVFQSQELHRAAMANPDRLGIDRQGAIKLFERLGIMPPSPKQFP